VYEPVYTSYGGGQGGTGGTGGYANRKIRVTQGDIVVVSVGGAGVRYAGGKGLTSPTNFSGGTAGAASREGRGGGGGGATVITVNGVVVAVAAGGGGGGGGGIIGTQGKVGGNAQIVGGSGGTSQGADSAEGPSTGGGGGGGYFGGLAGASSTNGSDGGEGGISYGTIIQAGSGSGPGGASIPEYPSTNPGYPDKNGAALLVFTKSFNINLKKSNNWRSIDRAWVKVDGMWKELLNGWTKVSGAWQPLITSRSIQGAENLNDPTVIYTLTPDFSSVDEGDTVTFTLGGTGLTNGTVVHYTATGIDATALTAGALSGNFVVGTTDTISFTPKLNHTTYGARTLKVFLDNKGVSASCIVNNISLSPVYSIFGDTASIDEGETVTFTMSSVGATTGEVVRWSLSGVNAADLSSGAMTGQFIVGSAESAAFTLSNDLTTEGVENITITLDGKGASASCAIADTSRTPVPFTGSLTISGSGSWTVPAYVTSATFTICGGGGGGGGSDGGDKNHWLFGLGGGASDLVSVTRTVSAGQTYSYDIGTGGAGGGGQGAGAAGGSSTIALGASTILLQSGGASGAARAQSYFSPGRGSTNGGARGGAGSAAGYKNIPGSAGQSGFGIITWSGIAPG
jgi:plastocyanin